MPFRPSTFLILLFWLASMAWLVWAKVLPPLVGGQAPERQAALPDEGPAPPVCWQITWRERPIGLSASQPVRLPDGRAELRSVVKFDQLPVKEMAAQLLGPLGKALAPLLQDRGMGLQMTAATRVAFDRDDALESFHTAVALGSETPSMHVRGAATEHGTLRVALHTTAAGDGPGVYRQEIKLPRDALVADAFSPQPQLRNLHVGQRWTIPVYRPFPPNSPMRIVAAEAERHELIAWGKDTVETIVVVYRDEAGSGIHTAREPIGRAWVRGDGEVLRQQVMLSNLQMTFERLPDGADHEAARLVQERTLRRLFGEDPGDGETNDSDEIHIDSAGPHD